MRVDTGIKHRVNKSRINWFLGVCCGLRSILTRSLVRCLPVHTSDELTIARSCNRVKKFRIAALLLFTLLICTVYPSTGWITPPNPWYTGCPAPTCSDSGLTPLHAGAIFPPYNYDINPSQQVTLTLNVDGYVYPDPSNEFPPPPDPVYGYLQNRPGVLTLFYITGQRSDGTKISDPEQYLNTRCVLTNGIGRASTIFSSPISGHYTISFEYECADDTATKQGSGAWGINVVNSGSPTASFTFTRNQITAPSIVQFDASVSSDPDGISTYTWNFGDGSTGQGKMVSHTYQNAGTYTATLIVTDRGTPVLTGTTTRQVPVSPPQNVPANPSADFTYRMNDGIQPDLQVTFDGSSSYYANGIAMYYWNFGDGTHEVSSPAPTYIHQYASIGLYQVRLRVFPNILSKSQAGEVGTITKTVPVTIVTRVTTTTPIPVNLPVAGFTANSTKGPAPLTVHFTDKSTSTTGNIVAWQWFLNYTSGGDNNCSSANCLSEQNPTYTYKKPGTYTVMLWVNNRLNQEDTEIKYNYITVTAPDNTVTLPTADFTIQLNLQALEAICDASPSYDPDGIAMYYWNFGDGSPEVSSNIPIYSHTYNSNGTYSITLRITDRATPSQSGTLSKPVTVLLNEPSPCFENYIESGSLKIKNDGSLTCTVQITSRDRSGAILLQEGTQVLDSNNHPVPMLNITRTGSRDLPAGLSDENFRYIGYAYHCLPDGTRFDNPAKISISLSEDEWSTIKGDDLTIRGYNPGESSWENQPTTIHPELRKITANLNHFSIFALFSRQSLVNTSSSNNTTVTQPVSIPWKGTPLSLVIPPKYAPLAAVTFGMALIIGGALAPDSGIFRRIRKFNDIIEDYLKSETAGLISRIEIEKRKISPHISGSELSILTFREIAVIASSAAIFALAFIFKDKIAVQWSTLLIFLIMGGVATIIHELGHRLFGRYYGYPSELQFWSLGAVTMLITAWVFGTVFAQPSRTIMQGMVKESDLHEVIVMVAGPLINLLFAGISFLLLPLGGYFTIMGIAGFSMNLLACVCSLIPVKPMDGERVFRWNKLFWALIWFPIFGIYCIFFIV